MGTERVGVLHVVHSLNVGGAERLVHDLARGADPARFAVSVACLDAAGPLALPLAQAGIPVDVLDRQPGLDLALLRRLVQVAQRRGAQVVHAHQYTPFFYGVLAARRIGARCIFTEHGRHFPDVRKPKRVLANQVLSRLAWRTLAVSEQTRRALVEVDGFPPERVGVLYNGVPAPREVTPDERRALRATVGISGDAPVVGICARLSAEKNLPLLLDGFRLLLARLPEAHLVVAGDGPARADLEAQTTALGLTERVHLLGFREDVPAVVAMFDVFVLSSLTEGTSVTLLEAMRAARPAVVTRVGGNPEILVDGVTGWLVESGDATGLATRLYEVLTHPEQARAFGRAARELAETRFDQGSMVKAYEALYAGG